MRVTRRRGTVRMSLDATESTVLGQYIDELAAALQAENLDGRVRARLFPDGVRDDPAAAAELRALTEQSLRETKLERVGRCRARLVDSGTELQLDDETLADWLPVLNDLRLSLGTELDVREDDLGRVDPDAPDAARRIVYYWLTELQDRLVHAAMS